MSQADPHDTPDGESDRFRFSPGDWGCVVIVLLVIGGIVCLMRPATRDAKEAPRRMQCSNNIKQITLALHCYHDDYDSMPPAYTTDEDGKPLHSWRVLLLPYIEQGELYGQIRLDEPWDSEYNSQFHSQMPSGYRCPTSKGKPDQTSYMWVVGPDTISDGPNAKTFRDVTAGLANVIYLVEVVPSTCWMAPVDVPQSDLSPGLTFSNKHGIGSRHRGDVINVGFLDGSVGYLSGDEAGRLSEEVKINRNIGR